MYMPLNRGIFSRILFASIALFMTLGNLKRGIIIKKVIL